MLTRLSGTGLLIALSLGVVWASPQSQGTGRRPTLSVGTDLVTLSVTVFDRHNAVVPGLTRDRFTIYDNGQRQSIDFFTNEDVPAAVGLVIDCSSSMQGHRAAVAEAASSFAAASHPMDEFFTTNFNEHVWFGLPPSQAFTHDGGELRRVLAEAPARGKTALFDAMARALDHLELGKRGRKVLIVVSDGGDNASARTFDEVLERAKRSRTVIYSVALVDPDDRDARPGALRALARETGGTAFEPQGEHEVMTAFTRIGLEIRSSYTIGFTPAPADRAGFRSIRVVVDDPNQRSLTARTRRGYYAASISTVID